MGRLKDLTLLVSASISLYWFFPIPYELKYVSCIARMRSADLIPPSSVTARPDELVLGLIILDISKDPLMPAKVRLQSVEPN